MSEDDFTEIDPSYPIRLMDGEDVDVPLWSNQHGLLFVEPEELVTFGFSAELAADIAEWGERSPATSVRGRLGERRPWATQAERDARGIALVRRMRQELGDTYTFVYDPDWYASETPRDTEELSDALDGELSADRRRDPQGSTPDGNMAREPMTEDQRVARNSAEPPKSGPSGAERWIGYLDWVRADLVNGVLGLSYDDQRTPRVPSGWTPLELLNHVLHMEQRWFVWGFLGEQVEAPWGDWNTDEPWLADDSDTTRPAARWAVPAGVTAEALEERLREIGRRTSDILRTHSLDARAAPGGRFDADPPSLEWICFHVLAEYARHAGHLDIVVELGGD